ncbi:MAG: hypothetical protein V1834_02550 [Candidatus Micrarchaeota archaeon]
MERKILLAGGVVFVILLAACLTAPQETATPAPTLVASPQPSVEQPIQATPTPLATSYPGGAIEEAIEKALA